MNAIEVWRVVSDGRPFSVACRLSLRQDDVTREADTRHLFGAMERHRVTLDDFQGNLRLPTGVRVDVAVVAVIPVDGGGAVEVGTESFLTIELAEAWAERMKGVLVAKGWRQTAAGSAVAGTESG